MPCVRGDRSRRRSSATDHKVRPPRAAGPGPRDRDVAYLRAARPVMRPGDERLHRLARARDLRLDIAVLAVPDPAHDAEPAGLALHGAAKPHPLDAAADHQVRDDLHTRTSLRN